MRYRYNPYCSCPRCRAHGYMGPAVLITLGVLFLLSQVSWNYWLSFDRTWPALLIVIGLVSFLRHSAPANGHVPREYVAAPPPATTVYGGRPTPPPGAAGSAITPTPPQPGGTMPASPYRQSSGNNPGDTEVHNG